jgi:hypothetical protein
MPVFIKHGEFNHGNLYTGEEDLLPTKKGLFVQRKHLVLIQPSPQLVDDYTCGTIPLALIIDIPG